VFAKNDFEAETVVWCSRVQLVTGTQPLVSRAEGTRRMFHLRVTDTSGVPRNFVREGGGVQQIQLRTEDRENGDLGAVAP